MAKLIRGSSPACALPARCSPSFPNTGAAKSRVQSPRAGAQGSDMSRGGLRESPQPSSPFPFPSLSSPRAAAARFLYFGGGFAEIWGSQPPGGRKGGALMEQGIGSFSPRVSLPSP